MDHKQEVQIKKAQWKDWADFSSVNPPGTNPRNSYPDQGRYEEE